MMDLTNSLPNDYKRGNFAADFKMFVCERMEVERPIDSMSEEYKERNGKASELYDRLTKTLTDEQKKLFLEYDEARTSVDALDEENAYTRGLVDGIELARVLEKGF